MVSSDSVWGYWRIPTVAYDVLGPGQRIRLALGAGAALAGLRQATCHLVVVPRAWSVDEWAHGLDMVGYSGGIDGPDRAHAWSSYSQAMTKQLKSLGCSQRNVFLGVRLAQRSDKARTLRGQGVHGAFNTSSRAARGGGTTGDGVSGSGGWLATADSIGRSLATSELRAAPATAGEIRWLIQRCFRRGLGTAPLPYAEPYAGRPITALADREVHNRRDHLLLTDPDPAGAPRTAPRAREGGHVAFLTMARFPASLGFPGGEWLARFDSLGSSAEGVEVEASVRFEVVPPRRAARDAARKLADATDQAAHIAGTHSTLPLALAESIDAVAELEHAVSAGQMPLVYAWARLAVSAPSQAELARAVGDLTDSYRDLGIVLVRPSGDQLSLFAEALPGGRLRRRCHQQRQPVLTLAGSMFHATSDLGDGTGPYLGVTVGERRSPVHFDPLAAALANRPTTVAICGAPGEGKTTLAQLLVYQMTLRGAAVVAVDPKGDAHGLCGLPGMEDAQQVRLGPEQAGLLDPFVVATDPAEARLLAVSTLQALLPPGQGAAVEHALLRCAHEESTTESPSLLGAVRGLRSSRTDAVRAAGAALDALAHYPLGRLCFSREPGYPREPGSPREAGRDRLSSTLDALARYPLGRRSLSRDAGRNRLRLSPGTLILLSFPGIDLPAPGLDPADHSLAERLAVAVMGLVGALCNRLVADSPPNLPKAVMFDEAWAITQSTVGRALVQRLARTGRSRNAALLLVSQNAGDLMDETVTNNVASSFCFRSTDEVEVGNVLHLAGVEPTEEHANLVSSLRNGQCLFTDLSGRSGVLAVDLVTDEIRKAFNTTPDRRW